MLYVIYMTNHPDLAYKDGQDSIIHLEADFYASIEWATKNVKRWVFTTSNAGSNFFEDYCDPNQLTKIDWDAVQAIIWASCREKKQAEFLVENAFPWHLIERIGVYSQTIYKQVANTLLINGHRPPVEVIQSWYY